MDDAFSVVYPFSAVRIISGITVLRYFLHSNVNSVFKRIKKGIQIGEIFI